MFSFNKKNEILAYQNKIAALQCRASSVDTALATIHFKTDGTIMGASDHFLQLLGYSRDELVGKHHSVLCEPAYSRSQPYARFWQDLASGQSQQGTFNRLRKGGSPVWVEATYFPVKDEQGNVVEICKIASDVTSNQERLLLLDSAYAAINRSMAVIEFTPEGEILTANENFLNLLGYRLQDIKGRHHKLFCFDDFYQQNPGFWQSLKSGNFYAGQFDRKTSSGDTVYLEATYNPVIDSNGVVIKVIKFATDVSAQKHKTEEIRKAAELSFTTAEETSQISFRGIESLGSSIELSQKTLDLIKNAVALITQLNTQAKDIEKIVTTIQGVAEQTNLLALNAAIEAARAGEQGRGFAVVADEVRALAHRTQNSTAEIEQMISAIQAGSSAAVDSLQKSTSEVYCTRDTAEQAGLSLRQITDSVLQINDRNLQIATASEEQAYVARDVDRSLISIRDLAIQSSEGTRQTLAASNELSRLSLNLNDLVLRFKT